MVTRRRPGFVVTRSPMFSRHTALRDLRRVGLAEGVSFLVLLLIAMPLKYFAGQPRAVQVVGMIHGILFIAFVLAAYRAMIVRAWPWTRFAFALLMSVIPGGTFYLDAKLKDEGAAVDRA